MARPSKLTPNIQDRIVIVLENAGTRSLAAKAAGVDPVTLKRWTRWGEAGKAPYAAFSQAVRMAEGKAEASLLACVVKAAPANWRAAAWILERRWPKAWGRRDFEAERARQAARLEAKNALDAIPLEELTAMVEAERARRLPARALDLATMSDAELARLARGDS